MRPSTDILARCLYRIEPKEFHWPFSAVYSRCAALMEPGYRFTARELQLPEHATTVLDIGGGDGRLAIALARQYPNLSTVVTADVSQDMVKRAQQRARTSGLADRVHAEVADVHLLKYRDARFDAVVSFASMHHWRNPVEAFRGLDRVLKPGGILAVLDGCGRPSFGCVRAFVAGFGGSLWASIVYWVGSKDVFTYEDVADIVSRTGRKYISIRCEGPVVRIGGVKDV